MSNEADNVLPFPSLELAVRRLKALLERRELVERLAVQKLRHVLDVLDAKPLEEMLVAARTSPPPFPLPFLLPALHELLDEIERALAAEGVN